MIRPDFFARGVSVCAGVLLSTLVAFGFSTEAGAQQGRGKAAAQGPAGGQAVGVFGDWGVYTSQGARKVCYILSRPKVREPKGLNRDPGYLFVSIRPAEGVRNEISWVLGFSARAGVDGSMHIDSASEPVVTRGDKAWLKDAGQEGQAVAAMARGSKLVLRTQSARGNALSDEYSLRGFTQALERARKECG